MRASGQAHGERSWTIIVPCLAACTLLLLAGAPNALRIGFPVLATVAAAGLLRRSRLAYIQFCVALWYVSPLLRRLVDYRTAFDPASPLLLLAPLLAAALSGVVLLRHVRLLGRRGNAGALPFACALAGIAFGTLFGLTRYTPLEVGRGVGNWLVPVLFGFFLYQEARSSEARCGAVRQAVTIAMVWGTLLSGIYGVVQFFLLPPWDRQWMEGIKNSVFGHPEPFEVRVFSTLNAPAPFAAYLMTGLLVCFAMLTHTTDQRTRLLAVLAAPAGLLALALTTSRSFWLGLLAGLIYLGWTLPGRTRLRLVAASMLTLVLVAASTAVPVIHEVVLKRLATFTTGHDVSAVARIDGHVEAFSRLASEPLGEGMGSTDVDHATDGSDDRLGPHDSTVLEFLYALGGPGTLVYAIGLAAGLISIFGAGRRGVGRRGAGRGRAAALDPMAYGVRAVLVGFFSQCMLNSIMLGPLGFLVWTYLALALATCDLPATLPMPRGWPAAVLEEAPA